MMALMNEIDLYEHKTPLPISPTSEGTPMTETHFRQTLYECAVKLRELAYTLAAGSGRARSLANVRADDRNRRSGRAESLS